MRIPCFQVDAFTDRPFTGNPAAVCVLDAFLPDATMQAIAAQKALSETAFVVARADGEHDLRWFTPASEVDLCGHATLATAHVLARVTGQAAGAMRFHTRSGSLGVVPSGADAMTMDFPSRSAARCDAPPGLADALDLPAPLDALRSRDLVIVLARAEEVRALRPDLLAIAAMEGVFAVCVTAPGTGRDADVDFVSRFFAPAKGVPEDPVTGSAHCSLAPLWAERLGKRALRARQVSARGGELSCEVAGDRVRLEGRAVLVEQGTIFLP